MKIAEFEKSFKLEGKVVGIKRMVDAEPTRGVFKTRCTVSCLLHVLEGNEVVLTEKNSPCKGGLVGLGMQDGLPQTPGGFGYFISCGRGEGFPEGERLKSNIETGERMILAQPQNVMEGYNSIWIKPYEDGDEPDTVTLFCNPDQLSAMTFLFNYSKAEGKYDTVIAPAVSGCASLFRIPFAEAKMEEPRAVIGFTDINARPDFDADMMTFTVSRNDFERMLREADESFVNTKLWERICSRI
jgi:uncharacterized protein (DUF169 family)